MLCRTGMLGRVKRFLSYDFPVMSDCSGAEGGILALQALGIKVDHISSSEINCIATDFIARNFQPRLFYPDVCDRQLHRQNYRCGALIAGFPCQFSVLRTESDLLDEEAARPFFAIVKTIGELRVPIYVLENVLGIKKCLPAVRARLGTLKEYVHGMMEIDSKAIGDVVSRPRLYFIGVLRKVAAPGISSNAKLQKTLDQILSKAKQNCTPPTPWYDLLLDDPDQEMPIKRRRQTAPACTPDGFMMLCCSLLQSDSESASNYIVAAEAIDILTTLHGNARACVNVSQQLNRMHLMRRVIPCLTPGSCLYVMHKGRCLSGLEMMLFQGFDISKLNLYGMDDKDRGFSSQAASCFHSVSLNQ
ncbi:nlaIVM [Symbiodinium sp. CCMP2592]|nr:nlaIVM [Symbiodinium sp. CCMP2592]